MFATTFKLVPCERLPKVSILHKRERTYLLLSNLAKFIGKLDAGLHFLLKLKAYNRYRYYLRSQGRRGIR